MGAHFGGAGVPGPEKTAIQSPTRVSTAATTSSRDGGLIADIVDITLGAGLKDLARQAVRDPNPIKRRLAFTRLLEALSPENALTIREQLVELGADGDQWRDFNYTWGALTGKEAFSFAAASEESDLDATLSGWASASPFEAIALLNDLPEELRNDPDRLAKSVVAGLADRDRNLATDLILNSGTGAHGIGMLLRLVKPLVLSPFVSHSLRRYLSMPNHADLAVIKQLIETGKLRPVIDKVYSLEETPEALRHIEGGHAKGKVVVGIEPGSVEGVR
ncbi:MAG: zinc-binding dehydrogenase [Verrucomicrobiae bacterium]|nr:zinc-binding dehydrogenase [Verrucomicrobiae bacterium]